MNLKLFKFFFKKDMKNSCQSKKNRFFVTQNFFIV